MGKREGFASVGKLTGAHLFLWRAACSALAEATLSGCNDNIDDQLPLFTELSPHHRIRLLREVALGLLLDEEPLPPETAWHYAAYLAPLHHVAFTAVAVECDMEGEFLYDMFPDDGGGNGRAVPTREDLEAKVEELLTVGVQASHEERATKKRGKKERKAQKKAGGALTAESVRSDSFGDADVAKWRQALGKMQAGGSKMDKKDLAQKRQLLAQQPDAFAWRTRLRAFFEELSLKCGGRYTNLPGESRRAIKSALLPVTEEDRDLWERLYQLGFGFFLAWPGGEDSAQLWSGVLFGPLDRAYDAARVDLVYEHTKLASKLFAEQWDAAGSIEDFRVLAVLADASADPPSQHGLLEPRRLEDSDGARAAAATGFALAALTDDAALGSLPPQVPGGTHPKYVLDQERAWAWAHLWHESLERSAPSGSAGSSSGAGGDGKRSDGDDGRMGGAYASPAARVKAVLSLSAPAGDVPDPNDASAVAALRAPPFSYADNDTVRVPPSAWQKEGEGKFCSACQSPEQGETKLLKCSGCSVALYCNRTCQKKHWKAHKATCKMLKAMASLGSF